LPRAISISRQSLVALAAERSVPIDTTLAGNVEKASTDKGSIAKTAGRFVHGLWIESKRC
jgi:hypothetical protein